MTWSVLAFTSHPGDCSDTIFQNKCGKIYCELVCQLYFSLYADQKPPAKISRTIKSVLKCFLPSLNTEDLILPHEKCRIYEKRRTKNN